VKITFGKVGKEIGTFDSSAERERERESICVPCQLPVFHSPPCLRLARHYLIGWQHQYFSLDQFIDRKFLTLKKLIGSMLQEPRLKTNGA
jgi:hypothetical protein